MNVHPGSLKLVGFQVLTPVKICSDSKGGRPYLLGVIEVLSKATTQVCAQPYIKNLELEIRQYIASRRARNELLRMALKQLSLIWLRQ